MSPIRIPPKTPVSMDSIPKIFLISGRLLAAGKATISPEPAS